MVGTHLLPMESVLIESVDLGKFLRLAKELKRFPLHEEVILPVVVSRDV